MECFIGELILSHTHGYCYFYNLWRKFGRLVLFFLTTSNAAVCFTCNL